MEPNVFKDIESAQDDWLKAMKKVSDFIGSDTFQLANPGTKAYLYANKRRGALEQKAEVKFIHYRKVMDYFLDEAVRKAAQYKVAQTRMNIGQSRRDDLWYRYTTQDMDQAYGHPQRFINSIDVYEAKRSG